MLGLLLLLQISKVRKEPAEPCHKTDKEVKRILLCCLFVSPSETSYASHRKKLHKFI